MVDVQFKSQLNIQFFCTDMSLLQHTIKSNVFIQIFTKICILSASKHLRIFLVLYTYTIQQKIENVVC